MKKNDLISGKHVVELEDGDKYLFLEGKFVNSRFWYDTDAKICKIFEIQEAYSLSDMLVFDKGLDLIWENKELTDAERVMLESLCEKYKWIARDRIQGISLHKEKPIWAYNVWFSGINESVSVPQFDNLFKMIDSENCNPTLIADLLEGSK